MISLPNLTLLSIDTIQPLRTIRAMQYSMLQVNFGAAVLVTSKEAFRPEMLRLVGGQGRTDEIKVAFVPCGPRTDYERQIIEDLHKFFTTSFCLFQEWDSAVINPAAWKHEWEAYDFIGAPWPYDFHEHGYPPCTKENCVGNGGFSLRSRRFCEATAYWSERLGCPKEATRISDAWISRTIRPKLEEAGMRFALPYDASRFSCENRFYSGEFGAHGKNTIAMNGWRWDFEWLK